MALDSYKPLAATNTKTSWPLAKFYFSVNLGSGVEMGFQAMEGLSATVEPYEFREGNAPYFHKEKRPGLVSYDAVTLKKGMFVSDEALYKWFDSVRDGNWSMRDVTVKLKDESGSDVFTWKLIGAFPTKFTPTSLDANDADEVAIEELELTCQSWEASVGGGGAFAAFAGSLQGALGSVLGGAVSSGLSATLGI